MADAWANAKNIFFREFLWLVATLIVSLLLALLLRVLLQTSAANYTTLVAELGDSEQALLLLLYLLCFVGVYVARCAAAAVGYLVTVLGAA